MKTATLAAITAHDSAPAKIWGEGGEAYNDISFAISDALAHAAQRLDPKLGEKILDVATGTGWSARNVARAGSRVAAIDIAQPLLAAATKLSAHVDPLIDFRLADAEDLPFADGEFDGIISTFGVMFAASPDKAAHELGRVCRRGGRLVIATWAPDGAVAHFFAILSSYGDASPPPVSPLAWGDPAFVEKLLGRDFSLKFEPGVSHAYHADPEAIWSWYVRGFGPLRSLAQALVAEDRGRLKRDLDAYHAAYMTDAGLHVKREYLVTIGTRR